MAGVLDLDMTTLAARLGDGFAWWTGELKEMTPAWAPRLASPAPAAIATWCDERFVVSRGGTTIAPAGRAVPVAVVLPPAMVLTRTLALPSLGRRDLAQLVELDLERLMPFPAGSAVSDLSVGDTLPDGRVEVTVAAMPRAAAETVLMAARDAQLVPRRLGLAGGFDFLPQLGDGTAGRAARFWWTAVAVLAVALVAALVVRDVQRTRRLQALVDAHAEGAASARILRLRVLGEDRRRRAWLAAREARDPVPLLAAASRALPDGAWVQRLDFDGSKLRLSGYRAANVDPVAALRRVGLFATVRSSTSDIAPPQALGQPFDVTAELAR